MKTLIISSSISKKSRSYILCEEVYSRLKQNNIEVELIDARSMELNLCHTEKSESMNLLSEKIANCDNIIIGMGVHCYSINDSLKILLDNCFSGATEKFFGIICAAGGERSYLSTMHLTQICMNEWRMIQLPRIVYATGKDFTEDQLKNKNVIERLDVFSKEFITIGKKLIS
jgi:FMN reductase